MPTEETAETAKTAKSAKQFWQIQKQLEKLLLSDAILMQLDAVQMQLSSRHLKLDSKLWPTGTLRTPPQNRDDPSGSPSKLRNCENCKTAHLRTALGRGANCWGSGGSIRWAR